MKNNFSILKSIKDKIDAIEWQNDTFKNKAYDVCVNILNQYISNGGDFYQYRSFSKAFFKKIIKTNSYVYPIINNLIDNNIIESDNSYNVDKGIGKGYRFTNLIITGDVVLCGPNIKSNNDIDVVLSGPNDIDKIIGNFAQSKLSNNIFSILNSILNSRLYHYCGPKNIILQNDKLSKLYFVKEVNNYIDNFKLDIKNIKINDDIELEYVNVFFENGDYRYKIENALELAKEMNKDLVQYKDKCYIENLNDFIIRKENDLKIIFKKSVFDIQHKLFRINRNETNRRLDYNLTNMKSNLIDYLRIDDQKLIEIDIKNAQFTILSYLFENELDEDFVTLTKEGRLYEYVASKLNISREMAKDKMFRVAFDKVKKDQNSIRDIFPKTMKFVDEFKKENGYSQLSILLQNVESIIMIDGLLPLLENYDVFTIHDAIRVKESQINEVFNIQNEFFNKIGFQCNLNIKNNTSKSSPDDSGLIQTENMNTTINDENNSIVIRYKGFKDTTIEKPNQQKKDQFKQEIINIINDDEFVSPSEDIIQIKLQKLGWQKEEVWYYWNNWVKKNQIYEKEN